ncbi:hypothetical protein OIY81_2366 [Cryptosporidium canis]|uniref:Uncharacterized protein n=1 Tax=Cryptosporidium canis TaxID=195482 RepID=A0ABQ8PAW2_9CRYT|nr:hypothetical protein OIY81_2366 [Cryptosporidium canis]KAJ1614180.1 hypothetical protein OJ252_798 [Cryptosporidium canis]
MIVNDENIERVVELKRSFESVLAKVDHRLELIEKSRNQESVADNLTLGNIAYIGLRYSSTTRAPPEYDDLTGKELSKRPSYRFPCPSNAHIQLSQLYNAKQLACAKPMVSVLEESPGSKRVEINSAQRNVDIIYQINGSKEQVYLEPILVEGPGHYSIRAFSRKPGFRNSSAVEQSFSIDEDKLRCESDMPPDVLSHLVPEPVVGVDEAGHLAPAGNDMHDKKHSVHSHSKYRGLHLIRNQVDSDCSESD